MTNFAESFDPEEFFKSQFGGDAFDNIFGELELASQFRDAITHLMASEMGAPSTEKQPLTPEQKLEAHSKRITNLSDHLISKLCVFTESFPYPSSSSNLALNGSMDYEAFETESLDNFRIIAIAEATQLATSPHGPELLKSIGYVYVTKSQNWLAKLESESSNIGMKLLGFGKRIKGAVVEKTHIFKETVDTVRTAVEWHQTMTKLANDTEQQEKKDETDTTNEDSTKARKRKESKPLTEEERRKLEAESATKSMEALWKGTKLEIESVIREVCDRVLGDLPSGSSLSSEKAMRTTELRRRRCLGLEVLGKAYEEVGMSTKVSSGSEEGVDASAGSASAGSSSL